MKVSVGVKHGNNKVNCDDSALVGNSVINDSELSYESNEGLLVAVADGVGGNLGGKEASLFILNRLASCDMNILAENDIEIAIKDINEKLIDYAHSLPGKETMASTLTGAWLTENGASYVFHIGNTRLYIKRGSYLKQITTDHTTYQWLLKCGQTEAAENCNKNEILSCMGANNEALINRLCITKEFGDSFPQMIVITSDGIHDYIEADDMEKVLLQNDRDMDNIRELMELAENNGSSDDKTILIVRR